jgi:hypothetical protein
VRQCEIIISPTVKVRGAYYELCLRLNFVLSNELFLSTDLIQSGALWAQLLSASATHATTSSNLIGCAHCLPPTASVPPAASSAGVVVNHAYAVLEAREVTVSGGKQSAATASANTKSAVERKRGTTTISKTASNKKQASPSAAKSTKSTGAGVSALRLVRVRNPMGSKAGKWSGVYAADSKGLRPFLSVLRQCDLCRSNTRLFQHRIAWTPALQTALGPALSPAALAAKGEAWLEFPTEFTRCFNRVYVCPLSTCITPNAAVESGEQKAPAAVYQMQFKDEWNQVLFSGSCSSAHDSFRC